MKFFNFGKKDEILDLSNYNKQEDQPEIKDNSGDFVLNSEEIKTPEEKRRKLAKRITSLTDKIDDLSNQIYHLQQRIELLERKLNIK